MHHYIQKNISLSITFCVFFWTTLNGHGFGPRTLIQLSNGSQKCIYSICLDSIHKQISVASYDGHNSTSIDKPLKIGKKSKANCHIILGFDDECDADIVCTPIQEFYIPGNQSWTSAYMLKIGDALLTKDMTTKIVQHKRFIPNSIKIYMIEVDDSHTFFVGKYGVLTHNIFLPLAASLGFSVPFGSVATGTAGSFFGPIGLVGGVIFGGIVSVAIKALYENHIHSYKTPAYNTTYIENYCHNMVIPNDDNISLQSDGCFIPQSIDEIARIIPIEYQLPEIPVGCIAIEVKTLHDNDTHIYDESSEIESIKTKGCFDQNNQIERSLIHKQEKTTEHETAKIRYREKARNWDEFEKKTLMGQQHGKYFVHTGKRNPKDNSPIRQLIKDIPNTEMFKKGYLFAIDKLHGDHFEVWKDKKWIGVANFDGSRNEKKTTVITDKHQRRLPY